MACWHSLENSPDEGAKTFRLLGEMKVRPIEGRTIQRWDLMAEMAEMAFW